MSTVTCPTWCVASPADHAHDDPGRPLHKSAAQGGFEFWQIADDEPTATLNVGISNNTDLNASELRQLAADARAAADWLDAHR